MDKISIIGIGLIGGSFAKDAKKIWPNVQITGISRKASTLEKALALGFIDAGATDYNSLNTADMVIVAIPVTAITKELPKILDAVGEDSLVFDAGSTKTQICDQVRHHEKRRNFLACHPIAGTEFSGPDAALEGLYNGKTNIICEVEQTAFNLQERALDFFQKIGMRIRYMHPEAHDKHIAYVSHLSHISSFMLGKTVIEKEKEERDIFDMAGSGFESTVRLAKSSPEMWTPIFDQNRDHVMESLKNYIHNLQNFYNLLAEKDFDQITNEMADTNRIKEILSGMPTKTV